MCVWCVCVVCERVHVCVHVCQVQYIIDTELEAARNGLDARVDHQIHAHPLLPARGDTLNADGGQQKQAASCQQPAVRGRG